MPVVISGPKPFHFQSMWVRHDSFLEVMKHVCDVSLVGDPMTRVMHMLKLFWVPLCSWNFSTFKDVNKQILETQQWLLEVQQRIASDGFLETLFQEEVGMHKSLDELLVRHELMLQDKCRIKWLHLRDRNSAFFDYLFQVRKSIKAFSVLDVDRVLISDSSVIKDHVIDFYKSLFSESGKGDTSNLGMVGQIIHKLVNDSKNDELIRVCFLEEMWLIVFSMDPNSAPGPYGFSGVFFQKAWPIVGVKVSATVQYFFPMGILVPCQNSSFIVLILKITDAISIDLFHPIECNFLYKVITKLLADHLALFLLVLLLFISLASSRVIIWKTVL